MARRPATTLILITREELIRADLGGSPRANVVALWRQPRPEMPDLATLVDAALFLSSPVGKKVWVLATDFWIQNINLPTLKLAGSQTAELNQAVNFEAENFSGVSALEAQAAQVELPGSEAERQFWMIQVRQSDLAAIEDVVHRHKGKLGGLGHPAALLEFVPDIMPTNSFRVELWPDVAVFRHGEDEDESLRIVNSDPSLGRWRDELRSWREEVAPKAEGYVLTGPAVRADVVDLPEFPLDDEVTLKRWLSAWADTLHKTTNRYPLVVLPSRPIGAGTRLIVAIMITLLAVGLCAGHWLLVGMQVANLQQESKQIAAKKKEFEDLKEALETRQGDCDKLAEEKRRIELNLDMLEKQRTRYLGLLGLIAQHRPADLLVEKIDLAGSELAIMGVCLDPLLADQMANRLADPLKQMGWTIQSATKEERETDSGISAWTFTMVLTEIKPQLPAQKRSKPSTAPPPPNKPTAEELAIRQS